MMYRKRWKRSREESGIWWWSYQWRVWQDCWSAKGSTCSRVIPVFKSWEQANNQTRQSC